MTLPTALHQKLKECFYPQGWWGGYAKFFEPRIPARIGKLLICSINVAIDRFRYRVDLLERIEATRAAINILSSEHVKSPPKVEPVICKPTEAAVKAVELLEELLQYLKDPPTMQVHGSFPRPSITSVSESDDGTICVRIDKEHELAFWLELRFTREELEAQLARSKEDDLGKD